jgi:integrase
MFYRFIIARQEDVKMLDTLTDDDIRLIKSALTRLDAWPKAFSDAANLRKAEKRKRDIEERLTTKDFQSFVKSERAREIIQMYETVARDKQPTVAVNNFSAMRDYLLLSVMMASWQRCGAASNLTIQEFSDGVWTETDGKKVYTTRTLCHKTSSGGPAKLLWDEQLKNFADTYLQKLRGLFANENSVAPCSSRHSRDAIALHFHQGQSPE